MRMDYSISKQLLNSLADSLVAHGFTQERRGHGFARITEYGYDYVGLSTIERQQYILLQPAMGIRHDLIEDTFHRTSGMDDRYKAQTLTLVSTLTKLHNSSDFEVRVHRRDDVPLAVPRIVEMYEHFMRPFFSKFRDIDAIDRLLNENPDTPCAFVALPWRRCSVGLIAASIVGRPNINGLAKCYHARLSSDQNGFYLPPFERLLHDIGIAGTS